MSQEKALQESTEEAEQGTKDPTLFLLLWLVLPAVLMLAYAYFGPK